MKLHMKFNGLTLAAALTLAPALAFAPAAWAGNVAHCEVLLIQTVEDEEAKGAFQISSYRPAVSFIASVHDDDPAHQTEIDGLKIKALLCRRNDVIPSDADYPMLASGVPFVLSQDFDSAETDSLTIFWKDGAFEHVYKGYPLSDEAQNILDDRLADFTGRGLSETAKQARAEDATASEALEVESEVEVEVDAGVEVEIEIETEVEVETELEAKFIESDSLEIEFLDAENLDLENSETEQLKIETPEIKKIEE